MKTITDEDKEFYADIYASYRREQISLGALGDFCGLIKGRRHVATISRTLNRYGIKFEVLDKDVKFTKRFKE
jgi:hypothetical protein